jgi:hypothetical protein
MKNTLRLIPLIMLISCASVQSNTIEKDGKTIHELSCSEFNSSLDEAKAKELCANNYKQLSHHTDTYPDAGDGFYMHPRHHLSVECNG